MALDPTLRKLTSMEKYQRSLHLIDLARSSLESCLANHPALSSIETKQLLTSANDTLTNELRTVSTNEIAESALSLAEKAWQERIKVCGPATSPDEEPLRRIMEKLAE